MHRSGRRTALLLYLRPMRTRPRTAYSVPKIGKGSFSPLGSVPHLLSGRAAPTSHQASGLGIASVQHSTHIPHLQTSTIGIICSCLQPVFAPLGLYLGDQGVLFEKCSFDKEGQIDG